MKPEEDCAIQTSDLKTTMCGVRGIGILITNGKDMRYSSSDDFGATANSTEHSIFTENENHD